jgi:hypothetical protein
MRQKDSGSPKPQEVADHYASGYEAARLQSGTGKLDRERSRELLKRFLPPPPATLLDVGGGPVRRVLKSGGVLLAVGISRFASTLDGLRSGFLKDPRFAEIVNQDLKNGQHRNPTGHPDYFMDTFFHHPDELRQEVAQAGFAVRGVYGVEGPGWLLSDVDAWWGNEEYRERLLHIARTLETEPSLLGVGAHLIAVAEK